MPKKRHTGGKHQRAVWIDEAHFAKAPLYGKKSPLKREAHLRKDLRREDNLIRKLLKAEK